MTVTIRSEASLRSLRAPMALFLCALLLLVPATTWGDTCEAPIDGDLDGPAVLPRAQVDVTPLDSSAWQTFTVGPSGRDYRDVQSAYEAAVEADAPVRIQIDAGHDAGDLGLSDRRGKQHWIYIEPANLAGFPPSGVRVDEESLPKMYRLRGTLGGFTSFSWEEAVWAERNAGFTRIIGADIAIPVDAKTRQRSHVVRIRGDGSPGNPGGAGDPSRVEELPQHVILDRVYVHEPEDGTRRTAFMVGLYGRHLAVVDSWIRGLRGYGEVLIGVYSEYGPGPSLVQNNRIAVDGMGVFLGGNTPAPGDFIPTDFVVRGNHIIKDEAWFGFEPSWVKNMIEIKNGRRVLVEHNVMENNWADGQTGKAILLRSEAARGLTEDIVVRYNHILDTPIVWDLVGIDGDLGALQPLRRVSIHDNVASQIGGNATFPNPGTAYSVAIGTRTDRPISDLLFAHNTHASMGEGEVGAIAGGSSTGGENLVFRDNIWAHGRYGVKADGTVSGIASMDKIFGVGNYSWNHNVGAEFPIETNPGAENHYPTGAVFEEQFVDFTGRNYTLVPTSMYRKGGAHPPSEGPQRGANVALLDCLTATARVGRGPDRVTREDVTPSRVDPPGRPELLTFDSAGASN